MCTFVYVQMLYVFRCTRSFEYRRDKSRSDLFCLWIINSRSPDFTTDKYIIVFLVGIRCYTYLKSLPSN